MIQTIDINADLGEGCGEDATLMPHLSSCNIACGGHAGDRQSMTRTVEQAIDYSLAIGAHPSFPDREGFGRLPMKIPEAALIQSLYDQIHSLIRIAEQFDRTLHHIKPHGALYNLAITDNALAHLVFAAFKKVAPNIKITVPPAGALFELLKASKYPHITEGFADRRYLANGQLQQRGKQGAIISDLDLQTQQAIALAKGSSFSGTNDSILTLSVDTICLHGDTPNAANSARRIRRALEAANFSIQAP